MSNLVANELFDGTGESGERKSRQIGDDIDRLRMRCRNLVVVTNEVSADGIFYDESTMEYIRCLNDVNIRMAEQAELVVEVAASLPVYWKKAQGEVLQVESCLMEKKENRMELIIGGYHQGKTDYIKKRYGLSEENMMDAEELTGCDMKGRSCLLHFHLLIRELLKKEVPVDEYLERLFAENEIRIITADEIGSGIVPVDAFERRYREETGRWVCRLAEKSERVIRVLYGIGQVMKGK
jgi:adenosylcobinamide kinase/adenosylcobinamide-phosphate guanylyltransferase